MSQNQPLTNFVQRHEHAQTNKEDEDDDLFHSSVPPIIFDAQTLNEKIPSFFNAVRIPLDATLKADLLWKQERQAAETYIQQGFRIFWEIQLGLFNQLTLPITNQSQFLSLSLALEHFRDTLWKEFHQKTVGLCLYRGTADFSLGFVWDKEQLSHLREWLEQIFIDVKTFAFETLCNASSFDEVFPLNLSSTLEGKRLLAIYYRDLIGEYLEQLSVCLPDSLQRYVLLDVQPISDPLLQVQLTTNERFSGMNLGVRGPLFNDNVLAWDGSSGQLGVISREMIANSENEQVRIGVCLPSKQQYFPSKWKDLEKAFVALKEKNISFRVIPEATLTTDWDGLDYLIVSSENLSVQGQRKLQGFRAAGGIVGSLEQVLLGLRTQDEDT